MSRILDRIFNYACKWSNIGSKTQLNPVGFVFLRIEQEWHISYLKARPLISAYAKESAVPWAAWATARAQVGS